MPWNEVLPKFKAGALKSGSGKPVKKAAQAVAIMLSERAAASKGKSEYKATLTPAAAARIRTKANALLKGKQ